MKSGLDAKPLFLQVNMLILSLFAVTFLMNKAANSCLFKDAENKVLLSRLDYSTRSCQNEDLRTRLL